MEAPTLWDHGIALVAGLVLPVGGALQHRAASDRPADFSTREKVATYWANSGLLALLAGATWLAWAHAGRPAAALGLTLEHERLGVGLALAATFAVLYGVDTAWQLTGSRLAETRARWRRDTSFMPATPREVRHSLVMVASAAVCEEIVYRGFLVAYVASFTGTTATGLSLAVALPCVLFALCHTYQGGHAVLKIALLAGLFGAILVATGSLLLPIALHFAIDLVGVLLGPRLLRP